MPFVTTSQTIKLQLSRDLVRVIKRGHPWVFADALRHRPPAQAGTQAILLDKRGKRPIARGFYDPDSPLAFRVCSPEPDEALTDAWAKKQMARALHLRHSLFDQTTTGYRLFNGEGDGLPGLICDIYGDTAVIQTDGAGPAGFWNVEGIAGWLAGQLPLACIYQKTQSRSQTQNRTLVGSAPLEPVPFLEHGVQFAVDVIEGQKTGFFLDQRDNRRWFGQMAAGRRVLNVFGYTGGFSVHAGLGGAQHVTTVDLAGPALAMADRLWQRNQLPSEQHQTVKADAFKFLADAAAKKQTWALIVIDPPSFTPSKKSVKQATHAYQKLAALGAAVTAPEGMLALSSCSSHINMPAFLDVCEAGVSKARRRATVLSISNHPPDHPTPLAFPEFRYLKFVVLRLD